MQKSSIAVTVLGAIATGDQAGAQAQAHGPSLRAQQRTQTV